MRKISVIIVNYNSGNLLKKCILSILKYMNYENLEIIVVDNNSEDYSINSVKSLNKKKILIIQNNKNLGFSKANNIGARIAKGEILFFLNPDTRIIDARINYFLQKIKDDKIYVPLLTNEKDVQYKNIYVLPTFKEYLKKIFRIKSVNYWSQGSAVIMTKSTYLKIGGWSEDYFMYAEDLDLFYTAYKMNIKLEILPFYIVHIAGGITRNIWSQEERALKIEKSYYNFSKKHSLLCDYHVLHFMNFFRKIILNPKEAFFEFYIYIKFIVKDRILGRKVM